MKHFLILFLASLSLGSEAYGLVYQNYACERREGTSVIHFDGVVVSKRGVSRLANGEALGFSENSWAAATSFFASENILKQTPSRPSLFTSSRYLSGLGFIKIVRLAIDANTGLLVERLYHATVPLALISRTTCKPVP